MTYTQTLEFLYSQLPAFHRIGKAAYRNDLNNTILLDNYFHNPHKKFLTIHIAGTNGKGSVSHMISSIFQEAGYKTGLYTSPHLRDFRERIRVNGAMMPESSVVQFVEANRGIIESVKPSFFEMTVAMAFNYFAESNIDIAVIEVGLGGRLDSTNIITPVLSVITNIGHDHMDLLGDTFEKIAREKAGIIKHKVPVIISETHQETEKVFTEKALETGSEILFADKKYSCHLTTIDSQKGIRKYSIKNLLTGQCQEGVTPLGGDYQAKNLQAVYAAAYFLKDGFSLTDDNISNGIEKVVLNTGLQGRWQILSTSPLTICDTGHNREGLEYVLNQIKRIPNSRLHMIIGFVNDKDLQSVLPLFPKDAAYYFTKASVPRALNEESLKAEAVKFGLSGDCYPDVKSALEKAKSGAKQTDLIFIGGSTFVVAEVV
jgi:dihydrofolate synthase / folylpolyglutamate synthase